MKVGKLKKQWKRDNFGYDIQKKGVASFPLKFDPCAFMLFHFSREIVDTILRRVRPVAVLWAHLLSNKEVKWILSLWRSKNGHDIVSEARSKS